MDLVVEPAREISGKITPSPSKFYTQFATAAALLADGKSLLKSPLLVDDTRYLVRAMEVMGATTKRSKESWSIWGTSLPLIPTEQVVDAKKSIMNLGLLTSLSSLNSRIMVVTGKEQVRSCPVPSLVSALQKLGVDVHSTKSDESPPLVTFESDLRGGEISLDEGTDPRFLPPLLLLAPCSEERVELQLDPGLRNVMTDMAIEILERGGIDVSAKQEKLHIRPGEYEPLDVTAPLDVFSALPQVLGTILTGPELEITKIDEAKNVSALTSLLEEIGVDLDGSGGSLKVVAPEEIGGGKYNLEEYPEITPFMAVLACSAEGKTRIFNAERARNMKSDRISTIAEELRRMGADIKEKDDGLVVDGPADLKGTTVDGHDDDAIVAGLGVAGLIAEGRTIVKNRAETLRESYPRFVSTFQELGAKMSYKS